MVLVRYGPCNYLADSRSVPHLICHLCTVSVTPVSQSPVFCYSINVFKSTNVAFLSIVFPISIIVNCLADCLPRVAYLAGQEVTVVVYETQG